MKKGATDSKSMGKVDLKQLKLGTNMCITQSVCVYDSSGSDVTQTASPERTANCV